MVKFILIKSPDEWATTKQACRDELVVYLCFSPIYIYIYIYIYKWFGWKVKTGLDVASRQRCFVICLTHQEFNTKCIYNNRHFKYP